MKNKRISSFILFTGATIVLFLSGNVVDFPKVNGGATAIGIALLLLSFGVILIITKMKTRSKSKMQR
jgi:hypothetical protein